MLKLYAKWGIRGKAQSVSILDKTLIYYLLVKVQTIIEKKPFGSIFLPQKINVLLFLGKIELKVCSEGDISMKSDADVAMRKLAQITRF